MRKGSQLHNIFVENERPGGFQVKTPALKELPKGTKITDSIDFQLTGALTPHPENDSIFESDIETPERWENFKNDIKENGIHDPLIVRQADMVILTGHRRHKAATEIGIETVPVRYIIGKMNESEAVKFMVRDNAQRRHWSTNIWLAIYRKIYPNFDELIFKDNRGGDRTSKGDMSPLKSEKLSIKKLAQDTGQQPEAVKQQIIRHKKKLKSKGDMSPLLNFDENFIELIKSQLEKIVVRVQKKNKGTKKEAKRIFNEIAKGIKLNE